jgi:xylan 1,4-beta-xylosidase
MKTKLKTVLLLLILLTSFILFGYSSRNKIPFLSRAFYRKADLVIDLKDYAGPLQQNWRALAQGGEESGVRMLENVSLPASALKPRYVRLDHIYDFYNVVSRDSAGNLNFDFSELDKTVCDIYRMGAKPFFSLGYMPPEISADGSLISAPKDWREWQLLVQKTVEHYSGLNTRICGGVYANWLKDIYYEVWNEPDLEGFGKWSIYGGAKDYRTLYYYSVMGATTAQNVNRYFIGGPVTTRPYRNWFVNFLYYAKSKNLRVDFLSWHHYSKDPNDYSNELKNVHAWLTDPNLQKYQNLPLLVTEWGYDSNFNPIADTEVGAAHTVATIRDLIDQKVEMAFAFEIKDGLNPSWGIFTHDGRPKPRFYALKMLNVLSNHRLNVSGEGSLVKAIASIGPGRRVSIVIVNYDPENNHLESVPLTIYNVANGKYRLIQNNLTQQQLAEEITVNTGQIKRTLLINPNQVITLEIARLF